MNIRQKRQIERQIINTLIEHINEFGCPATAGYIGDQIGIKRSVVNRLMNGLVGAGYLAGKTGYTRSWVPLKNADGQAVKVQVVVVEDE